MTDVRQIFWRAITRSDMFHIERTREAGPSGGGGQTYISISFQRRDFTHRQLGEFLGLDDPGAIGTDRPSVTLDVGVLGEAGPRAPLTFAGRYRPPNKDDRYMITRQNRQFLQRHPAWVASRGFPRAPDDIASKEDPRLPDVSHLKVLVLRTGDGEYLAGFVDRSAIPAGCPPELAILYAPNSARPGAGVITLEPGILPAAELADLVGGGPATSSEGDAAVPPEVLDAEDAVRVAAGKQPVSQGRRQSAEERKLIEDRAMAVATEALEAAGWHVEDVSRTRSYDLHCSRGAEERRVEVKGTTGRGERVILTPNEVSGARDPADVTALHVVSGIRLSRQESGELTAEGGRLRVLDPWEIDVQGELRPTGYDYRIDAGAWPPANA